MQVLCPCQIAEGSVALHVVAFCMMCVRASLAEVICPPAIFYRTVADPYDEGYILRTTGVLFYIYESVASERVACMGKPRWLRGRMRLLSPAMGVSLHSVMD